MNKLIPGLTTLLISSFGLSSFSYATLPPDIPLGPAIVVAPEPVSSILFIVGGAAMAARHFLKNKNNK